MENDYIYNKWTEFINDDRYKKYFISNKDKWYIKLNEIKEYIDKYNKLPYLTHKNMNIKKLNRWYNSQIQNYNKKLQIMQDEEIYDKWEKFINDDKYKKYFISNVDKWLKKLEETKIYIDNNEKRPHEKHENITIRKLGNWVSSQVTNHKKKIQIMQNKEIYDKWTKFINDDKYKKYFGSNKQIWLKKLQQVKNYIDINNILPSSGDINNHIKELALWIMYQKGCYKKINKIMKDKDIYAT